MKQNKTKLTREDIAKLEIGHTEISRPASAVLVALFLLAVFSVPVGQVVYELRTGSPVQALAVFREVPGALKVFRETGDNVFRKTLKANAALLKSINGYEDTLEERSLMGRTLLGPAQYVMVSVFGHGNEKAYVGRDGWLFFRPSIDYASGPPFLGEFHLAKRATEGNEYTPPPQPDPVRAVLDFHERLSKHGIQLVVVPAPGKAAVHPGKFSRRFAGCDHPVRNLSFESFTNRLETAGVWAYDPAPLLVERKLRTGENQFLPADTHWTPQAMDAVAKDLASFLRERAGLGRGNRIYERGIRTVSNIGDIAAMLNLPDGQTLYPEREIDIQPVGGNLLWSPSLDSKILLLGDSFSNVYSLEPMGWGESAGFAEQLSYHLRLPLDRIVQNDAGSHATRRILSRELAAGRDRLEGKIIVIWEFAARELTVGDWEIIPMESGEPGSSDLFRPESGTTAVLSGTILDTSPVPRPESVPYRDHIFSVILVDLKRLDGTPVEGTAYVQMWSMRDRVRTPASRYPRGRRITVRLSNWKDVGAKYDAINKSLPGSERYEFETPCWGQEITK
ncbi:MAG: hypothetical protein R6V03_02185 [Kiritimatiellia bacterium]